MISNNSTRKESRGTEWETIPGSSEEQRTRHAFNDLTTCFPVAGEKSRVFAGDSSSHLKFKEEEWHRENRDAVVVVIFNGGTRITESGSLNFFNVSASFIVYAQAYIKKTL